MDFTGSVHFPNFLTAPLIDDVNSGQMLLSFHHRLFPYCAFCTIVLLRTLAPEATNITQDTCSILVVCCKTMSSPAGTFTQTVLYQFRKDGLHMLCAFSKLPNGTPD
jgi:hypothetical protein